MPKKRDTSAFLDCPEHRGRDSFFVQFTVPEDFWTKYRATLAQGEDTDGFTIYHDEDGRHIVTITEK
jgi:hypothetical protein